MEKTTFHFRNYAEIQAQMDKPDGFRFLPRFAPATFECCDCRKTLPLNMEGNGCGTGYATDRDTGLLTCYPCAGKRDERDLLETGKGVLYLGKGVLTNWPGTLKIKVGRVTVGPHNLAGKRYDVWFHWKGYDWHGVQIGDNTQICRVKRLKDRKQAA